VDALFYQPYSDLKFNFWVLISYQLIFNLQLIIFVAVFAGVVVQS
jgi:hypothetical protein